MCSRCYVDVNLRDALERIKSLYGLEGYQGPEMIKPGDVKPSEKSLVIRKNSMPQGGPPLVLEWMTWGYLAHRKNNQLLINARIESAEEKPAFSSSFLLRRCLIPASGFYEWDREKNKADFRMADGKALFLAGCYDMFENARRFTVFTTQACGLVVPVHDRMPLMISMGDILQWFENHGRGEGFGIDGKESGRGRGYRTLIEKPMPKLACRREYEQMSLLL